jgi:hypothetical protein
MAARMSDGPRPSHTSKLVSLGMNQDIPVREIVVPQYLDILGPITSTGKKDNGRSSTLQLAKCLQDLVSHLCQATISRRVSVETVHTWKLRSMVHEGRSDSLFYILL